MRLLILTPEYEGYGGGIKTYYRALAPALRAAGVEVSVLEGGAFHAEESRRRRELDGVSVESLEKARLESWVRRFPAYSATPLVQRHLAAAWAMWEQANSGADFDVIEAVDWGLSFVPPVLQGAIPVVVQCHGSLGQIADHDPVPAQAADEFMARFIERAAIAIAPAVQTYYGANADFWRNETSRPVVSSHPAWNPPRPTDAGALSAHGAVFGRLQRWKGPETICEALRILGAVAPSIDWYGRDTVWGSSDTAASIHLAGAYPDLWGKRFHHLDQVPPEDVARLQGRASFNVIPSTWDVFNFTVVEAMASGRPTIVSAGAGASKLVVDGENGFLFPAGDASRLANTIQRVMHSDPAKLAEIGRAARATIEETLEPGAIAQARIATYTAIISAFKAARPQPIGGWLAAMCAPSDSTGNELAFLENIPLGSLLRHTASRIRRKLGLR